MARFNGKQDLNKTQIAERRSRRARASRGLKMPLGTKPREHHLPAEPGFVPTRMPIDPTALLARLKRMFNR